MSRQQWSDLKKNVPSVTSKFAYLRVDSITTDPLNPRLHSREQIRAIARSIEAFGFNAPILVDSKNRVVAGHGRLEAAKLLKLEDIPVVRLEHLTEHRTRAYMLADNKLSDRSCWDDNQLALRLKELQELAIDFEIEATGFEMPEIDFRIQSLEDPDAADAADEFTAPEGPIVSQLGDLWKLGSHRLLCGDALDPEAYDTLLGPEQPGMVFADPPFNVPIHGHAAGRGRRKYREFAMAHGEMDPAQFSEFLQSVLRQARSRMEPNAVGFMCMDWRHLGEALGAISQSECELVNLCVWEKANGGMGSLYRSAHELVLVFKSQGARSRNNVQLGRFGRNRTNVWHYPGMNSFALRGRTRDLDLHPTVKPVALVADAILDVSKYNDIVLDPFCGSGTTILAAGRTGRRGYGIELDPQYIDVAIARWQGITHQSAMHACGKSFVEICSERQSANAALGGDSSDSKP